MRACRSASVVAFGALGVALAIGACREAREAEIPPVTTARPEGMEPLPSSSGAPKGVTTSAEDSASGRTTTDHHTTKPAAIALLEGAKKLESPVCSRLYVAAIKGIVTVTSGAEQDKLDPGDVLLITHIAQPGVVEIKAPGLALHVVQEFECNALSKPPPKKTVIVAKLVPELTWAGGAMHAKLILEPLVATGESPDLYLGRLEGTAPVAEHDHPTSTETLVTIEASGSFTLDGKESRLGPRQIVHVPKGVKHSWKPDPGSKLVALQIYEPPGPEKRFVALAEAEGDAAKPDLVRPDAGKR